MFLEKIDKKIAKHIPKKSARMVVYITSIFFLSFLLLIVKIKIDKKSASNQQDTGGFNLLNKDEKLKKEQIKASKKMWEGKEYQKKLTNQTLDEYKLNLFNWLQDKDDYMEKLHPYDILFLDHNLETLEFQGLVVVAENEKNLIKLRYKFWDQHYYYVFSDENGTFQRRDIPQRFFTSMIEKTEIEESKKKYGDNFFPVAYQTIDETVIEDEGYYSCQLTEQVKKNTKVHVYKFYFADEDETMRKGLGGEPFEYVQDGYTFDLYDTPPHKERKYYHATFLYIYHNEDTNRFFIGDNISRKELDSVATDQFCDNINELNFEY